MEADMQKVIEVCQKDAECPFTDFHCEPGNLFSFNCVQKGVAQYFTIKMADTYPKNSVLYTNVKDEEEFSEPLPQKFYEICKVYYKEIPSLKDSQSSTPQFTPDVEMLESSDSQIDCNSDVSQSGDDDSAEEDYDSYYHHEDAQYDGMDETTINTLLAHDIELLKKMFGEKSVEQRVFCAIDDIDIELNIGISFLDEEIAKAWRVNRHEPIVLRLHLSYSKYLDSTPPQVEVFQPSNKDKFGLGSQLRTIMKSFISEHWGKMSNASVKSQLKENQQERSVQSTSDLLVVNDQSLARLLDMGFSVQAARNALVCIGDNVNDAVQLLIAGDSGTEQAVRGTEQAVRVPSPNSSPEKPNSKRLKPLNLSKKKKEKGPKVKAVNKLMISSPTTLVKGMEIVLDDDLTDFGLHLSPGSTLMGKKAVTVPTLEYGFLVQVMLYARQRVPTLNEYCVVCDQPHVFQNGAMLKPAVCSRDLCVFSFQTLGVMCDAAEDIATGAEVVDLLVAMANAACRSGRREQIFEPFPTVVDPEHQTELALHPKNKDFTRVTKCLDNLLTVHEMTRLVGVELKSELDRRDRVAHPLLQWIISSNRSHIVKLQPEKQLKFMHTPHQFLLLSDPPAKEVTFCKAKQAFGSTFAFHGSNIENWHSIMRCGLINASGTKKQLHGAAYGKGIYMSPLLSVASGYSNMGVSSYSVKKKQAASNKPQQQRPCARQFLNSDNLTCIALCEVITSKDLQKHGSIWVCPKPDHVCTRFFFVYEDGKVGMADVNTEAPTYQKDIMAAVGYTVTDV